METAKKDRAELRRIFDAGIAAADPDAAVTRHLADVAPPGLIIAVGKAALSMARAALRRFPDVPCIVVTNAENAAPLPTATVLTAGHPIPDADGLTAGRHVIAALSAADGPVLALISGGGSALLPAPAGVLALQDKHAVTAQLLGAGVDIRGINLVRQQLSDLKGGGFLRHAAPWPVTALILSDVVGDDIATIASGLTAPPIGTADMAVQVLRDTGLWNRVPDRVRQHLKAAHPLPVQAPQPRNILVGTNRHSLDAMLAAAPKAHVIAHPITGDVAQAARHICDQARPGLTLWGGETTVRLRGTGTGGRNQELALHIALEAQKRGWTRWCALAAGSDGRDGPTDAAGGIVDQGTLGRIGNYRMYLDNNDSYAALAAAGDLLITGATGTNVADLGVMLRHD